VISIEVIIPFAVLGRVLPRFSTATEDLSPSPTLAYFLAIASFTLYGVFLALQTSRHRSYFVQPGGGDEHHHDVEVRSTPYHALMLVMCLLPIVLLSKKMAVVMDFGLDAIGAPPALGGFLVAILVLSPEGLSALHAARANPLQRTMNICLGSALATIGLTIPAVLTVGFISGEAIQLGLGNEDLILLLLTLMVSIVNFSSGKTNILQGAIHLLLFLAYIVTIFD
jgi:Ca2+:H+ antiporter